MRLLAARGYFRINIFFPSKDIIFSLVLFSVSSCVFGIDERCTFLDRKNEICRLCHNFSPF